jgi:hypothetical protein
MILLLLSFKKQRKTLVRINAYYFIQVFSFIPVTRIFDIIFFDVEFSTNMPVNDNPVNTKLKTKCCFQDMIDNTPPQEQGRYELYLSMINT